MEELIQSQAMYFASLTGGIAFALSGFLAGTKKNLDWMGLFILSFLTANGGGILRDILTDRPPVILLSNEPFLIALTVTLLGSLFKLGRDTTVENRWLFVICDAIGLVAFAITGALVALAINAPFFGFITLAFLTAVGGAILRDILVNNIPEVLHSGFYGSIAILVALAIYLLYINHILTSMGLLSVFTVGVILRIAAYHYQWKLPKS
ncbi:MAG: trimeric intracellular cation channel family protein [Rickettsiales bacterium]|nr:trimeric intracellular cation channel family protein [Rickettsiales bacterium]